MHAEETCRRLKATASLIGLHCARYCLYCTSAAREALSEPPPPPHPLSLPPLRSLLFTRFHLATHRCTAPYYRRERWGRGRKQVKCVRPLMIHKNKSAFFFNVHIYLQTAAHTSGCVLRGKSLVCQSILKPLCGFESMINSTEVAHSDG